MTDGGPGVRLELRYLPGDYTLSIRGRTVVCSLAGPGGVHRLRLLGVGDPTPLLGELPDPYYPTAGGPCGFRVVDRNAVDGGQREVGRFGVAGWLDDSYEGKWSAEVSADAVEYFGPDDALPRRWPTSTDAWERAALPLEFGG